MWQVADVVLPASALEVVVERAVAAAGFGVDESRGATQLVAAGAAQYSFEVVVVDSVASAALAAGIEDVLHPAEECLVNDGFVATVVKVALVGDLAEVIGVAQHLGELVDRDRLTGPAAGRTCR